MLPNLARRLVKWLRFSQPFNGIATAAARLLFLGVGGAPDIVVRHLPRAGTVSLTPPDGQTLRLWSRGDDWVSNRVYWHGMEGYQPESTHVFFRLAAGSPRTPNAGAYLGHDSLIAALANPSGRVVAFEAFPRVAERLRRNVAVNRLRNVVCVDCAVGDVHGGEADFHCIDTGLPTSSSLSNDFMDESLRGATEYTRRFGGLQRVKVPTITLDGYDRGHGASRVGLVKVDVEGTEPAVLRGMRGVLERDRPHVVCEVLPGTGTAQEREAILRPLGYRFYHLTPGGPAPRDAIVGHPEWLNYLFTPADPAQLAGTLGVPPGAGGRSDRP